MRIAGSPSSGTPVEVGTPGARRPPHRSRREICPHRAFKYSDRAPDDSLKLRRSGMALAGPHHAAPMGLKTVLFGRWYYKQAAPTELAA